jgi:hypothetical protein
MGTGAMERHFGTTTTRLEQGAAIKIALIFLIIQGRKQGARQFLAKTLAFLLPS